MKRKTTPGSQTHDIHYTENKANYKTIVLTYPYAIVIPLTLTRSLSWTLPNQVSYLKGSSMDSFTLGPIPKIDFTRTVEHTPSLSTMEFDTEFIQFTSLGPSIYRLIENLNPLKFRLWLSIVRTKDSHVWTVFCDRLSETAQLFPYQVHLWTAWPNIRTVFAITPFCVRTEHWNIWNSRQHPDVFPRRPDDL
jgi:hypothetical protein